jgi:[NiFe] hydrogenase diaphorase moiety large subunit
MQDLCTQLVVQPGETREDGRVSIDNTSCTGLCDQGPAALINGRAITHLDSSRINQLCQLINNQAPVSTWPEAWFKIQDNIQKPDLLLATDLPPGSALNTMLARGPDATLKELETSGLRGRGGAGFNTASKWRYCREAAGKNHYVVCNADEGEPGTFKDRVLLNSYSDEMIEGMTLCARIINAQRGFIYLRGEYLFLFERLQQTLERRRHQGLLGNNIAGLKHFDFDIEIHLGAGAYICGEESALIEALEGKRGIPRNRPPFPVTAGYLEQPTVVNNVETFVAAAKISRWGGAWFNKHGTSKSPGTKILSICGDCIRPGLYEYPFGTSVMQILNECGAKNTMGVQVGGPSGTFISAHEFHRTITFEDLSTGGAFIIFDQTRQLIDIVTNFSHFFAHESCGFCTPCRVGTSLVKNLLDKIHQGFGSAGDLVELRQICQLLKNTSHCGLGHTAANPVIDTLERFPEVYQQKLKEFAFAPGFDLDAALETTRQLSQRDDPDSHLHQVVEND